MDLCKLLPCLLGLAMANRAASPVPECDKLPDQLRQWADMIEKAFDPCKGKLPCQQANRTPAEKKAASLKVRKVFGDFGAGLQELIAGDPDGTE